MWEKGVRRRALWALFLGVWSLLGRKLEFDAFGGEAVAADFVYFVDGDEGVGVGLVDGGKDAVEFAAGGDAEDGAGFLPGEAALGVEEGGADIFLVEELGADLVGVGAHDEELDLGFSGDNDFVQGQSLDDEEKDSVEDLFFMGEGDLEEQDCEVDEIEQGGYGKVEEFV